MNSVSSPQYPKSVNVSSLPLGYVYVIEKMRPVNTKYGLKIILDFQDKKCIFVPDETNNWLFSKPKQIKKMEALIKERQIGFKNVGYSGIEFVDLTNDGKGSQASPSEDVTTISQKTNESMETEDDLIQREAVEADEGESEDDEEDKSEETSTTVHIK